MNPGTLRSAIGWIGVTTLPAITLYVLLYTVMVTGWLWPLPFLLSFGWPAVLCGAWTLRPRPQSIDRVETSGKLWGLHWVSGQGNVRWGTYAELAPYRQQVTSREPNRNEDGCLILEPSPKPDVIGYLLQRTVLMGCAGLQLTLLTMLLLVAQSTWMETIKVFAITNAILAFCLLVSQSLAVLLLSLDVPSTTTLLVQRNRVVIDGRPLVLDPEWVLEPTFDRRGARITIGSAEHVEIVHGRFDELTWLVDRLRRMPAPGDRNNVPEALGRLSKTSRL